MTNNLSPHQFPVEHLAQFANPDRMTDERFRRHVENLAEGMRQVGYHRSRGPAYMSREHGALDPHKDIEIAHVDAGTFLNNGNHRVFAAQLAGLSHLPAVERDYRTDPSKPVTPAPYLG